jgi:hypothetical protein
MTRSLIAWWLAVHAATALVAQTGQEPQGKQDQAAQPVQTPPATQPSAPAPSFARIQIAETKVRCFAGDRAPAFEDPLTEGAVIRVGAATNGYREVLLPQGVTGWVAKKYCSPVEQGSVTTTASSVAFRYRPQAGEAPVQLLKKETALTCIGEQGDWWKVRSEIVPGYLPEGEVQVFQESNATLEGSFRELEKTRAAQWQEAIAAFQIKAAADAAHKQRLAELDTVGRSFLAIASKPHVPADLEPLAVDANRLASELPAESADQKRAAALKQQIEHQIAIARATELVREPEQKDSTVDTLVTPEPGNPMSRFESTGWLMDRGSGAGPNERYQLVKGGKVLCNVVCSSGRYDLKRFSGFELGVIGRRTRISSDSVRVVDADKIEVIGKNR